VKLADLSSVVPAALWEVSPEPAVNPEISGLCWDSRRAGPGDLFFALPGLRTDGLRFLPQAAEGGAVAVVIEGNPETPPDFGGPVLSARNARAVMSLMACAYHGDPTGKLRLVGITGTDGKTTCCWIVRQILSAAGRRAVAAGTLGLRGDDEAVQSWDDLCKLPAAEAEAYRRWQPTTPEAPVFQEVLASLQRQGIDDVVAEISSHALSQYRVYGSQFSVVALTHVAADHLDYHRNPAGYRAAKERLFDDEARGRGPGEGPVLAVLNLADDLGRELAARDTGSRIVVGDTTGADLRVVESEAAPDRTRVTFSWKRKKFTVEADLVGSFQVENLAISTAVCLGLGLKPAEVVKGMRALGPVPGRFETIRCGQPFTVVVDYAHTADALDHVLQAARAITSGRLIAVFGCGGDRDATKRPDMGAVAGRRADEIILTTDNPRSERPEAIIVAIEDGLPGCVSHTAVVDRRAAIAHAFDFARDGDTVVIAGRGAETTQVFQDRTTPFDDRDVARELLAQRWPAEESDPESGQSEQESRL